MGFWEPLDAHKGVFSVHIHISTLEWLLIRAKFQPLGFPEDSVIAAVKMLIGFDKQ